MLALQIATVFARHQGIVCL